MIRDLKSFFLSLPTASKIGFIFCVIVLLFLFFNGICYGQTCPQSFVLRQESCPVGGTVTCSTKGNTLTWQELDRDLLNAVGLCNGPGQFVWPVPSAGVFTSNGSGTVTLGDLACTDFPALTGNVTTSAGSCATTLAVIPTGVTANGTVVVTNTAAPSSPSAGKVTLFTDSTDLRLHDKNASGTIGTTVVADVGASNNFLTGITTAGAITKAQPSFTNLSGSATDAQVPNDITIQTTSAMTVGNNLTVTPSANNSLAVSPSTVKLSNDVNDGTNYSFVLKKSRAAASVNTNEIVGDIGFNFVNSTPAEIQAGIFRCLAVDKTAGSEDLDCMLYQVFNGSLSNRIVFRSDGGIEGTSGLFTGNSDKIQLNVKGNATQTNYLISAKKSDNTIIFGVSNVGVIDVPTMHNAGGTGATQAIASGTYTPTCTGVTNVATCTPLANQWIRVGSVITVSGGVSVDPTTGSISTNFTLSLPVASNLTASNQLGGAGGYVTGTTQVLAPFSGNATSDVADITYVPDAGAAAQIIRYSFTYVVL